jgi:hypothetical protein
MRYFSLTLFFLILLGIATSWGWLILTTNPHDPYRPVPVSDVVFSLGGLICGLCMLVWCFLFRKKERRLALVGMILWFVWFITAVLTPAT